MSRPRVIIADNDCDYMETLQLRLAEELYDQIDLEIYTDNRCLTEFFSEPQKADVLIISEKLYDESIKKHDIKNVFLLTETNIGFVRKKDHQTFIYKYTNIKEIFAIIFGTSSQIIESTAVKNSAPKMIVVTSAAGGVGKTTVAMGIAAGLAQKYKRVLYLNSDYLHNFQDLLINPAAIADNEFYRQLSSGEKKIYGNCRHLIRKEEFDYLPPFKAALVSLGISHSVITELAIQAKKSRDYDYVVVDADSSFDLDKITLISNADHLFVITTQEIIAAQATNRLAASIDLEEKERLRFVCNKFDAEKDNALVTENISFRVNDYIEVFSNYREMKTEKFASSPGIQTLLISIL